MTITRRAMMRGTFLGALGLLTGRMMSGAVASSIVEALGEGAGYGPLTPAGAELALPAGFRYIVLSRTGDPMGDGRPTPALPDGMGSFAGSHPGHVVLARNHELSGGPALGDAAYDQNAAGGVTTLVFDAVTETVVDSSLALAGTVRNCSGGVTPWGTWLTCEETTSAAGAAAGTGLVFARDHGFVFEVDPLAPPSSEAPVPYTGLGRFLHEGVAFDDLGVAYLTEDNGTCGFYRFIPDQPGSLHAGQLQMLAVATPLGGPIPGFQTWAGAIPEGTTLPVTWVPIEDPAPASPLTVYRLGVAVGGATFANCEGIGYANGVVWFVASTGGAAGTGQVWAYRPGEGTLTLVAECQPEDTWNAPDNICITPRGGVLLCQDVDADACLLELMPDGTVVPFALALVGGELAGATFSADGKWLFTNLYDAGVTVAITGPWERGTL